MSHSRATNHLTSPYSVIKRPVLTEKTHAGLPVRQEAGSEHRARYVFEVHPKSTKHQIRIAIETAFGVEVESVNTQIIKPRAKTFRMATKRGREGMSRLKKRAIIRLTKTSKAIELI